MVACRPCSTKIIEKRPFIRTVSCWPIATGASAPLTLGAWTPSFVLPKGRSYMLQVHARPGRRVRRVR